MPIHVEYYPICDLNAFYEFIGNSNNIAGADRLRTSEDLLDVIFVGKVCKKPVNLRHAIYGKYWKLLLEDASTADDKKKVYAYLYGEYATAVPFQTDDLIGISNADVVQQPGKKDRDPSEHPFEIKVNKGGCDLWVLTTALPTSSPGRKLSLGRNYTYTNIADLKTGAQANLYAVVTTYPVVTRLTDTNSVLCAFRVRDDSCPDDLDDDGGDDVAVNLFVEDEDHLPELHRGDVIRIHRAYIKTFNGRLEAKVYKVNDVCLWSSRQVGSLKPRTTAKVFTFTEEDKAMITAMRSWANSRLGNILATSATHPYSKLSDFDTLNYKNLLCQVVGSFPINASIFILLVWDGTKPKKPTYVWTPTAPQPCHRSDMYKLVKDYVVEVAVYDDHCVTAVKLKPGQMIVVRNLRAAPKDEGRKLQFNLHRGSMFGRGIEVVDDDSSRRCEVKLREIIEDLETRQIQLSQNNQSNSQRNTSQPDIRSTEDEWDEVWSFPSSGDMARAMESANAVEAMKPANSADTMEPANAVEAMKPAIAAISPKSSQHGKGEWDVENNGVLEMTGAFDDEEIFDFGQICRTASGTSLRLNGSPQVFGGASHKKDNEVPEVFSQSSNTARQTGEALQDDDCVMGSISESEWNQPMSQENVPEQHNETSSQFSNIGQITPRQPLGSSAHQNNSQTRQNLSQTFHNLSQTVPNVGRHSLMPVTPVAKNVFTKSASPMVNLSGVSSIDASGMWSYEFRDPKRTAYELFEDDEDDNTEPIPKREKLTNPYRSNGGDPDNNDDNAKPVPKQEKITNPFKCNGGNTGNDELPITKVAVVASNHTTCVINPDRKTRVEPGNAKDCSFRAFLERRRGFKRTTTTVGTAETEDYVSPRGTLQTETHKVVVVPISTVSTSKTTTTTTRPTVDGEVYSDSNNSLYGGNRRLQPTPIDVVLSSIPGERYFVRGKVLKYWPDSDDPLGFIQLYCSHCGHRLNGMSESHKLSLAEVDCPRCNDLPLPDDSPTPVPVAVMRYIFVIRLLIVDGTGRLMAYLCKDQALKFFRIESVKEFVQNNSKQQLLLDLLRLMCPRPNRTVDWTTCASPTIDLCMFKSKTHHGIKYSVFNCHCEYE